MPSSDRTNPSARQGFTGLNNKNMPSVCKTNPSAREHQGRKHRRAKQPCSALPKKEKRFGLLLLIGRPARKRTRKGKVMNRNLKHTPRVAPCGHNYNELTFIYFKKLLNSIFRSNPVTRLTKSYTKNKTWLSATARSSQLMCDNLINREISVRSILQL